MVKLAKAGILSNSSYPLSLSMKTGLLTIFGSLACFATFVILAICGITLPLPAWLFPTITTVAGMGFVFNGMTNLYVDKIYSEVKNRPDFIIEEKINIE